MKTEKYIQYLKSPEWKEKREQVLLFRGCACQKCSSKESIHIHHGTYIRIYKEKLSDLFVLCADCHLGLHEKHGNTDLLRATKFFIKGLEYFPRKKRTRLSKTIRKERREQKELDQIPKAIEAIKKGLRYKDSGIHGIKNWRKALRIVKLSINQ